MSNEPRVVYTAGPLYEVQVHTRVGGLAAWLPVEDPSKYTDLTAAKARASTEARKESPTRVIVVPGITHSYEPQEHE